eukprot:COSAG02_NODE_3582_length_6531_cov_4.696206_4_plen_221_part_00
MQELRCLPSLADRHRGAQEEAECGRLIAIGGIEAGSEYCKQPLGIDTWIALLPFWLRLLQCLRRHHDEAVLARKKGDPVKRGQLWNAGKYSTCLCVILLSYADHIYTAANDPPTSVNSWSEANWGDRPYHSAWLLMVVVSTLFKLYWDLVHDWGFPLRFWQLRPAQQLLYPCVCTSQLLAQWQGTSLLSSNLSSHQCQCHLLICTATNFDHVCMIVRTAS